MLSVSKEEKEFIEKQSQSQGEKKRFLYDHERVYVGQNYIEQLTDRELQEKQTYYLSQIYQNSKSIKTNVQFFFYLAIISFVLSVFIAIQMA